MGQIVIRQLDDVKLERLKQRARTRKTSVEALAREAIHQAAELTREEKLSVIQDMQEWSRRARVPGVTQSLGVDLIREDRDFDH